MKEITPCLWFDTQAEEAARFYTSIFKDSQMGKITRHGAGGPAPEGTVLTVSFSLNGQSFTTLNGGPHYSFTPAISFVIPCDDQEEINYYWEKLLDGGQAEQCGWLKDKFGVSWQIIPANLGELLNDPDPARVQRAMGALMQMVKIDMDQIRRAAEGEGKPVITVQTTIDKPIEEVWKCWTQPEHIVHWNNANDDWHTPTATSELRPGGKFNYRMEAKDGSFGFDFEGTFDSIIPNERLEYTIADGRKVKVLFSKVDGGTHVMEIFEAENSNPLSLQQQGWQAILDNFKRYVTT